MSNDAAPSAERPDGSGAPIPQPGGMPSPVAPYSGPHPGGPHPGGPQQPGGPYVGARLATPGMRALPAVTAIVITVVLVGAALIAWALYLFRPEARRAAEAPAPSVTRSAPHALATIQPGAGGLPDPGGAQPAHSSPGATPPGPSSPLRQGLITDAGAGDCVLLVSFPLEGAVRKAAFVSCSSPHGWQVAASVDVPGATTWPGDTALDAAGHQQCPAAVATVLTVSSDRLTPSLVTPTRTEWDGGMHRVLCLVARAGGGTLAGSVVKGF